LKQNICLLLYNAAYKVNFSSSYLRTSLKNLVGG
jgi:hypothetical protein